MDTISYEFDTIKDLDAGRRRRRSTTAVDHVDQGVGENTFSATPLAWTHAQFVRLAQSLDAGHPVETPSVVACRYQTTLC